MNDVLLLSQCDHWRTGESPLGHSRPMQLMLVTGECPLRSRKRTSAPTVLADRVRSNIKLRRDYSNPADGA
jgi:hypothetical protein